MSNILLNSGQARIFRIVHRDNLPWLFVHGLHCRNSATQMPDYRVIGNPDLIDKRRHHPVPVSPGGTLGDYVPFYFTPWSKMLFNIVTGRGVPRLPKEEIVFLVTNFHWLAKQQQRFVFTDRHALLNAANYYAELADLRHIDWALLQSRDFRLDPDDPEKGARYQAEALVHSRLPITSLTGLVCYTPAMENAVKHELAARNLALPVVTRPAWYF